MSSPTATTTITTTNDKKKSPFKQTLYFGYGSNLWLHQMRQRCPTSQYKGIARLNDYKWIINERGYANVVQVSESESSTTESSSWEKAKKHSYAQEVWGLVYTLESEDEKRLDRNEGVPVEYGKEDLEVDFWETDASDGDDDGDGDDDDDDGAIDTTKKPQKVDMLVYISRDMVKPSPPKREYVYRMNMGIKDAMKQGVPREYVEQVMRPCIPDLEDKEVEEVARRQALEFEDEVD